MSSAFVDRFVLDRLPPRELWPLMEWAGAHPTDAMSASGVQLDSLSGADLPLSAVFTTPRGRVTLAALARNA